MKDKKICKRCESKLRMGGFGVQVRPYRDGLTNLNDPGYAVVIPFSSKIDELDDRITELENKWGESN